MLKGGTVAPVIVFVKVAGAFIFYIIVWVAEDTALIIVECAKAIWTVFDKIKDTGAAKRAGLYYRCAWAVFL